MMLNLNTSWSQDDSTSMINPPTYEQLIDELIQCDGDRRGMERDLELRAKMMAEQKIKYSLMEKKFFIADKRGDNLSGKVDELFIITQDQKKALRRKSIALWTSISSIPLVAVVVGVLTSFLK